MEENQQSSKPFLAALGLGGVAGAGASATFIPKPFGFYVAVAIIVLVLLAMATYFLLSKHFRKRKSEGFGRALRQSFGASRSGDAEDRKKVEDLRKKWEEGWSQFEKNKKNPYQMPWYLMIGPSGWGKTEALRHAGLQTVGITRNEPMMGVGGTVNMDWWMFKDAIVLDTAGKMVFGDPSAGVAYGPEGSPEWSEFLKLLKKSRPLCPINGVVLTLSVKGLMDRDKKKVKAMAASMAGQMELLQRELNVRFPLYIVITFSDLLVGFSDLFSGLQSASLSKDEDFPFAEQMFGWSSGDLETPLKADQVADWVKKLAGRISKYRYSLLKDPTVVNDAQGRRLNEVDELYALPESMERFARNLQSTLEIIFAGGDWMQKQPFFRGLFFASSMRQGAALDLALAESLDVDVSELRAGRSHNDEAQSFFIHDLFAARAFKERGLVTEATNVRAMTRRRFITTVTAIALLLTTALSAVWWSAKSYKARIGAEAKNWEFTTKHWTETANPFWLPIVGNDPSGQGYIYYGDSNTIGSAEVPNARNLAAFHASLAGMTTNKAVPWYFFAAKVFVPGNLEKDRVIAQKTVFDRGALLPLLQQVRTRMQTTREVSEAEAGAHVAALLQLIRLQAEIAAGNRTVPLGSAGQYVGTFLTYLGIKSADTNLAYAFSRTYNSDRPSDLGFHRVPGLSEGTTLPGAPALSQGLDTFLASAKRAQNRQEKEREDLRSLTVQLKALEGWEKNLLKEVQSGTVEKSLDDLAAEAEQQMTNLTALVLSLEQRKALVAGTGTLAEAYTNLQQSVQTTSEGAIQPILTAASGTNQLFAQIRDRLNEFKSAGVIQAIRTDLAASQNDLARLDQLFLQASGGLRPYARRLQMYAGIGRAEGVVTTDVTGQLWDQLEGQFTNLNKKVGELEKYSGAFKPELKEIADYLSRARKSQITEAYVGGYVADATKKAQNVNRLTAANFSTLLGNTNFFNGVDKDITHPNVASVSVDRQKGFLTLSNQVTAAKKSLVDKYVRAQAEELRKDLGFPVLWKIETQMNGETLEKTRKAIDAINQQLAPQQWPPAYARLRPAPLLAAAKKLTVVMNALANPDGQAADCIVSIKSKTGSFPNTLRYITLRVGETKALPKDWTKEDVTGKGNVLSSLLIEARAFPEDKEPRFRFESYFWGPIEAMKKYEDGYERSADGKTWTFFLKGDGAGGDFPLMIQFTNSLPALADWPKTFDDLNLSF